jgi:hypothetical protein
MSVVVSARMFGKVACLVLVEDDVATVYLLNGASRQQIVTRNGEPVCFHAAHARSALGVAICALESTFGVQGWQIPLQVIPPLGDPVYIPMPRADDRAH